MLALELKKWRNGIHTVPSLVSVLFGLAASNIGYTTRRRMIARRFFVFLALALGPARLLVEAIRTYIVVQVERQTLPTFRSNERHSVIEQEDFWTGARYLGPKYDGVSSTERSDVNAMWDRFNRLSQRPVNTTPPDFRPPMGNTQPRTPMQLNFLTVESTDGLRNSVAINPCYVLAQRSRPEYLQQAVVLMERKIQTTKSH